MKRFAPVPENRRGVFPVPPLARRPDAQRTIDFEQNDRIITHLLSGDVTAVMYGGNAFLYHVTLTEYQQLLDWLTGLDDSLWCIPSAGPSFGRLMDQAPLLRARGFPCAMALPCSDPRDAAGLERGLREFADAAGMPLILYLKDETNFGSDRIAGLEAIGRLVDDGVCFAIKYAIVRDDPGQDEYLASLLRRVERSVVISGIGERPAVAHMRDFGLGGFTTGSGCIAPAVSLALFHACASQDYIDAEKQRCHFLPLEDLRDSWGPARVLHAAVAAAGIAETGPVPPFQQELNSQQAGALTKISRTLAGHNQSLTAGR